MLVTATERAFFNRHLIEEGETFHAYEKGFDEDNLPHYLTPVEAENKTAAVAEVPSELKEDVKVSELPEEQRQALLDEAKDLGITGNLNSYKVSSLKKKIASKSVGGEGFPGEDAEIKIDATQEDEGTAE